MPHPTPDTPAAAHTLDLAAYALAHGLTAEAYHRRWQDHLSAPVAGLPVEERRNIGYAKLNAPRSQSVTDAYAPSDRLRAALHRLPDGQTWVVLTDDWCGDSAFVFPVIETAAAHAPAVTLRVLPRDEHLGVMDRYLTNGGRAIPILIALDADGAEAWTWGPRSAAAVAARQARIDAGDDKHAASIALVGWYEAGGWRETEPELTARIEAQTGAEAI